MIPFEIRAAQPSDRMPIQRMLEPYQHDISDIYDQDLDCHGEYGYALDRYWDTEDHHAFVVTAASKYAGLALVSPSVRIGTEGLWLEQFFVLKKYRRLGAGRHLAEAVFKAFPGRWEVGQMQKNFPAQAFWREVISGFSGGRMKEYDVRNGAFRGIVQVFDSPARP